MKTATGLKCIKYITLLIILIALSVSSGQCELSGPKLVMDSLDHDFKEVTEGSTVNHVFKVKNRGDKELVINKVKPN